MPAVDALNARLKGSTSKLVQQAAELLNEQEVAVKLATISATGAALKGAHELGLYGSEDEPGCSALVTCCRALGVIQRYANEYVHHDKSPAQWYFALLRHSVACLALPLTT